MQPSERKCIVCGAILHQTYAYCPGDEAKPEREEPKGVA